MNAVVSMEGHRQATSVGGGLREGAADDDDMATARGVEVPIPHQATDAPLTLEVTLALQRIGANAWNSDGGLR
jgi:hypothetical protein